MRCRKKPQVVPAYKDRRCARSRRNDASPILAVRLQDARREFRAQGVIISNLPTNIDGFKKLGTVAVAMIDVR